MSSLVIPASTDFRVRICPEEENMTVRGEGWGIGPVAVDMDILIVEARGRVVPFSPLDGISLVADINQVQPIHTGITLASARDRVQFAVGQLMVDEDAVVVLCHLDINYACEISVIC